MFKQILALLIIACLAVTACSPTDNLARGGTEKDLTAVPETTAESTPQVSAGQPKVVGEEGSLYPPQDLSLVSTTGRPQILNSYADWCTTCQHNLPIVQAIAGEFEGKVDLISLNIDLPETQDVRDRFNITDRSQYLLVDASGNLIQRWYGFLDQTQVTQAITDYLATLG
ncbi:MAG: redoxin domain-containing protein [Chloroflexi bacterium]|nr:redoxin domain-containing protein [Chloroflexota bacterium]MCC6893315.1 redoxin domain-containing protein [Anaerolineae bacterium]